MSTRRGHVVAHGRPPEVAAGRRVGRHGGPQRPRGALMAVVDLEGAAAGVVREPRDDAAVEGTEGEALRRNVDRRRPRRRLRPSLALDQVRRRHADPVGPEESQEREWESNLHDEPPAEMAPLSP